MQQSLNTPVTWLNGCNQSVPAALRYLANNERPIGGSSHYNSEHLLQLASEIERMAAMELCVVQQPEPWSGEGLPPVGTDCSCGLLGRLDPAPLNEWREGDTITCVAHVAPQGGALLPLFWNARTGNASTLSSHCYRPIRTAAQIAKESRLAAAQEWLKGVEREYGVEVADQCEDILLQAEDILATKEVADA